MARSATQKVKYSNLNQPQQLPAATPHYGQYLTIFKSVNAIRTLYVCTLAYIGNQSMSKHFKP